MNLEQTARAVGRLVPWTCRLRNRFLAGEIVGSGQRQARGGRQRSDWPESATHCRQLSRL